MSKLITESLLMAMLGFVGVVGYYLVFEDEPTRSERGGGESCGPGPANLSEESAVVIDNHEHFLTHEKRQRRYVVHVPKGYDGSKALPTVLGFHGGLGHAESLIAQSRLNDVADRYGFLVVYPDGTGRTRLLTWNAGLCCGYAMENKVDDVGFVRRLLDELPKHYRVDHQRVYATGISNGAMLSYRLAHELADRITAIAPVAGGDMSRDGPKPKRAVPVIHFHGLKDTYAHFNGGKGPVAGVPHPPILEVIDWWVKHNHCQPNAVEVKEDKDYIRKRYAPAPGTAGAPVVLVMLREGGHTWPGGVDVSAALRTGKVIATVDASSLMWQFFAEHALPAPPSP